MSEHHFSYACQSHVKMSVILIMTPNAGIWLVESNVDNPEK